MGYGVASLDANPMMHPARLLENCAACSPAGIFSGSCLLLQLWPFVSLPIGMLAYLVALAITKLEIAIYNRFPARQLSHLADNFFGWTNSSHQA